MKIVFPVSAVAVMFSAILFVPSRAVTSSAEVIASREPFVESIVEGGTVNAARVMLYGAPLGSLPSKIVQLAPEGSVVEPGDLLVRLDTAPLEQLLARELAALRRAEADLRQAQVDHARHAGAARLRALEAETALAEAEREVTRSRTAVEDLRPMLAEGFITRAELEGAEQALGRALDQRRVAAARLELEAAGRGAAGALPPPLEAARSQVAELQARVEGIHRQIALSTIRAERPGLLVYRELFFGSERRKPQVGDEALPNQPLVAVPDSSELTIETRVREIDLHRVAASQRVAVRVDAYPDLELTGRIDVIGALAHEDASRAGTKFFPVTIRLDRGDARLRTGMTARVEIEVAVIRSAVVLPRGALREDDEGAHCLVVKDGAVERRAVDVWARNDTHVAVRSGLAAGERVRLPEPAR